jgi:predicted ATPase
VRREQIKLQVALIYPLAHVKGYAAPETKAAAERARLLIEQADALGDAPEDPLLLFSVIYSLWNTRFAAFNGIAACEVATEFMALAEKQGAAVPLMVGHRIMGISLVFSGKIVEGRGHFDSGFALYNPAEHRRLATRFAVDVRVGILVARSIALWVLGYPEAARSDAEQALRDAQEIGHAATLMFALAVTSLTRTLIGDYLVVNAQLDEVIALAEEKGALLWKAFGILVQGDVFAVMGKASDAVQMITSGIAAMRSTGSTFFAPLHLSYLARAHAELGQFDDAWRCLGEAMTAVETTGEKLWEAEVYRTAGDIALSPEPDAAKAEGYFERALTVARQQQAKSWELRAAMSLARLWRDQGKVSDARELLAPVYGWFTEGFDTRDLKEAKALIEELAS